MIATLFVLSKNLLGQGQTDEAIVYSIVGPYDEYRTAPIIYIKTKVHFSDDWISGFTEAQRQARVQGIFSNLNQAFNPHGIYFLAEDNACNTPNSFTYHPFDSDVVSSADIGTNEIVKAIEPELREMIKAIKDVLQETPPELAADIIDQGIIMSGGSSLLRNMHELVYRRTGVKATVAEEALYCVAKGTGIALEHLEVYKRSISAKK